MEREDHATLRRMGFDETELRELGLWDLAIGEPSQLADAYIRRSRKTDDLATLRKHLKEVAWSARGEEITIRHVWFEQRSASKAHVRREEFENAVKAILGGKAKTLYVFKLDRLSRRGMGAVDRLIDDISPRGARIVSTSEGLDSSKPGMRIIFGILADRAREEAKTIGERVEIGKIAHKQEGRWPGGQPVYGMQVLKGTGTIGRHPDEYPTSRRIAKALLKYMTLTEVADMLNSEGLVTRNGKLWRARTVHQITQSPSWAGLMPNRERVYDADGLPLDSYRLGGEPLMGPDGKPISCGEGVVTYDEWLRIRLILSGRTHGGNVRGPLRGVRRPTNLLSVTLKCPHCGSAMKNCGESYKCGISQTAGKSSCIGSSITRRNADEAIGVLWRNYVLALPDDSDTLLDIAQKWLAFGNPETEAKKLHTTVTLDTVVDRVGKLQNDYFILHRMTEERYETLNTAMADQIKDLKAELAILAQSADMSPLRSAEMIAALWDAEGIEGKRALIKSAVRSVKLLPALRRGRGTPAIDRLEPDWSEAPTASHTARVETAMDYVELTRQRKASPASL